MDKLTTRLEGSLVVLEPLGEEHAEGLWEAAQAQEIWAWLAHVGESRERFDEWMELALAAGRSGEEGPFATRAKDSGELIGSSRYLNVRPADRVVEIGWTWLNPSAWRTGANLEAKLLMLEHAFEGLGCVRVEFKTDARNERSRNALAGLPARFEGVMRNHMIVPDVGLRDSAYFSVIEEEWPAVRRNLLRRLSRAQSAGGDRGEIPSRARAAPETPRTLEIELAYSSEAAELGTLEPLWNALQAHHSQITPNLGGETPKRDVADAWRMRRSKYERWLEDPRAFFVVARQNGAPVGYAFVTVGPGYASWATGEQLAELETLSVLPEHRSGGIGGKLLNAAWDRLAELGVEEMAITTTETNGDAQRFYERQGFERGFALYYGRSPASRRNRPRQPE